MSQISQPIKKFLQLHQATKNNFEELNNNFQEANNDSGHKQTAKGAEETANHDKLAESQNAALGHNLSLKCKVSQKEHEVGEENGS